MTNCSKAAFTPSGRTARLAVPAAIALPQVLIVLEPRHVVAATGPVYVLLGTALAAIAARGTGSRV